MSIGERIRYIRNLRGMTQKELGKAIGFDDRTADIRIAQYESGTRTPKANYVEAIAYESGTRTPKANYVEAIAKALNVKTYALNVPETDTYLGLIHTLFALEDTYGIKINSIDGELCLTLDKHNKNYITMFEMLNDWRNQAEKLKNDEISEDEYDDWKYNYPNI